MAGKITGLRFQKRTADRVNVYLDDRFAFGLPALEAARLRVGQYLTDADIEAFHAVDQTQKAYDRAVRFLSYRPRSIAEVRRYLSREVEDEAVIEAVIGRLTDQGYLDDVDFARYWVENRTQFRPKGPRSLRQELRQRGLEGEAVDAALARVNPEESAYRAAQPRASRIADLAVSDPATFRRQIGDFLLRRGFDYETVRSVVNRLADESGAGQTEDNA